MNIQSNISLKKYNTFGIDARATHFLKLNTLDDALEFFRSHYDPSQKLLVLGGGSNVLFTKDFNGLVLLNDLKGIKKLFEDEDYVYVEAMAGENWHEFVQYSIQNNWAGLENLSLIPGKVGASPMQNIGAYGVEVKSVIEKVKAIEIPSASEFNKGKAVNSYTDKKQNLKTVEFSAEECRFGYRTSIFKTSHKNRYFISSVVYRLSKKPSFNISYGAIADELEKLPGELSIQKIAQAVINIRQSKLPDPKKIGNAGSFFKNPVVEKAKYLHLLEKYPEIPVYPINETHLKFAAGWLIEQCGWKGKDCGGYGVHEKQSLVLVNREFASGREILELSRKIIQSVEAKFGIKLEREVNVI